MFGKNVGFSSIKESLTLVEVICGLVDHTHTPAIRLPSFSNQETIFDNFNNLINAGDISKIKRYVRDVAPHIGGLNLVDSGLSQIRNGYQEFNKGIMIMRFVIGTNNYDDLSHRYLYVVGYITDNPATDGLSTDAVFTPVYSWTVEESRSLSLTNMSREIMVAIKGRRDYLLNDGSHNVTDAMYALRPCDLTAAAIGEITNADVINNFHEEGIDVDDGCMVRDMGSSINSYGTLLSKRNNYNPTLYAQEYFTKLATATASSVINRPDDMGYYSTADVNPSYGAIDTAAAEMQSNEYLCQEDHFLMTMHEAHGTTIHSKKIGNWTIADIMVAFPNFEDACPPEGFEITQSGTFQVVDYAQDSERFGTANFVEMIAQEIVFNMMDLMLSNCLSEVYIGGGNINNNAFDDGRLSNISLHHGQAVSIINNDIHAPDNATILAERLTNQIFNKLNGHGLATMIPVTIEVHAKLLGMTKLSIRTYDDENRTGATREYVFPTYAPTPWSPVIAPNDQSATSVTNASRNMESYFIK